jgi:uncharacterized protein YggU (UPF0235/DUF167 family)
LKIRVAAPPVDGAANTELRTFLAKLAGIPKSQVRVAQGKSGRRKVIHLEGVEPVDLLPQLGG